MRIIRRNRRFAYIGLLPLLVGVGCGDASKPSTKAESVQFLDASGQPTAIAQVKELEHFPDPASMVSAAELILTAEAIRVEDGTAGVDLDGQRTTTTRRVILKVDSILRNTFGFDGDSVALVEEGYSSSGTPYVIEGHRWTLPGDTVLVFAVRDPADSSSLIAMNEQAMYLVVNGKISSVARDAIRLGDTVTEAVEVISKLAATAPPASTSRIVATAADRELSPSVNALFATGRDDLGSWELFAGIYDFSQGRLACASVVRDRTETDRVCIEVEMLQQLPKGGVSMALVSPAVSVVVLAGTDELVTSGKHGEPLQLTGQNWKVVAVGDSVDA